MNQHAEGGERGRTEVKKMLIGGGIALFAALFLLSGGKVLNWFLDSRQSRQEFEQVTELLDHRTPASDGLSGKAETPEASAAPVILEEYRAVYEQNSDFIGWIKIEGTNIDYPVMQTPDDPDFYLKRNFEKEYSYYGIPYLQADCDIFLSDNLVIYGHHMNNKSMFSDLCKYRKESFYNEHKTFQFNTLYSYGVYEIIAVFKTTSTGSGYPYYKFVDAEDEQAFQDYVEKCKELSLYEIEPTAQYGDKLVTLSTCEYSRNNGRMVVVGKLIEAE